MTKKLLLAALMVVAMGTLFMGVAMAEPWAVWCEIGDNECIDGLNYACAQESSFCVGHAWCEPNIHMGDCGWQGEPYNSNYICEYRCEYGGPAKAP